VAAIIAIFDVRIRYLREFGGTARGTGDGTRARDPSGHAEDNRLWNGLRRPPVPASAAEFGGRGSIGIDDAMSSRNPGRVSDSEQRAERFADRFRAVYLTFHRRDGPRSQLQGASRAVLEHLAMAGPLTIGEAAAHLNRAQSVVSEIVSHLEGQGLLERESDPGDRRRTLVWLTGDGQSALRQDREVLGLDQLARAFSRLPPDQADDLLAGLQSLVQAADPVAPPRRPATPDPTARPRGRDQNPPLSEGDSDDDDHPGL
jgi:DNA-binding MarR family transcriptional regulator